MTRSRKSRRRKKPKNGTGAPQSIANEQAADAQDNANDRPSEPNEPSNATQSSRTTIVLAATGAILLWAAFAPVGWWPLAWVAPVAWCVLAGRSKLSGRRPYRIIYLAGVVHWLLVIHWIRLPYWAAWFGWFALAGYLAVYLPAFVGLTRQLVHRWRVPLIFAAPVVWCGLELVRGYLMTGFSMALLGHTQVNWMPIIQIADIGGAYAVGFLVMLVAAAIAQAALAVKFVVLDSAGEAGNDAPPPIVNRSQGGTTNNVVRITWPLAVASLAMAAAWFYGDSRIKTLDDLSARAAVADGEPDDAVKVALIQGSRITTFSPGDDRAETVQQYKDITRNAVLSNPDVDLIVWPESMLMVPWLDYTWPVKVPPTWPQDEEILKQDLSRSKAWSDQATAWIANSFGKHAILGSEAIELTDGPTKRFNRATLVNDGGDVVNSYNKMHPVMFGEYIPLGNIFPWLYRLTPMGNGLNTGESPTSFEVGNVRMSPCICYENTVPHLIRRQVNQLSEAGKSPHALVTITNDGWFWGSSQLELHLACGIFRAIETRRPMLIAANTGVSADIAATGKVRSRGTRLKREYLIASVRPVEPVRSVYLAIGDWLGTSCALVCLLGGIGIWRDPGRGSDPERDNS